MLEINNQNRNSGKTTKVIEMMKKDSRLILIIPMKSKKQFYPEDIQDRIITGAELLSENFNISSLSRVVLDEGFLYNKEGLVKIYYALGYNRIDVVLYGTEPNFFDYI